MFDSPAAPSSVSSSPLSIHSFDPSRLSPQENYELLSGSVLPRPIAFISSMDEAGVLNLAPYSFFTVASVNPPVVCFCPSVREARNGLAATKDTLANIRATSEFVVNIVSEDLVEKMNQTAAQVPADVDEFVLAGLTPLPSVAVRPPRVAESRVQLECRMLQVVSVSQLPMGGSLVLGQVVRFHVASEVLTKGKPTHIDPAKLRAVGRMAGSDYVRTGDRFALERPR